MGPFNLSWKGLLLHLDSLFEESGGADAIALLDSLSTLSESQRSHLLNAFNKVAKSTVEQREKSPLQNDEDALVEKLCNEILEDIKNPTPRLSVVRGGKSKKASVQGKIIPVKPIVQ